MFSLVDEVFSSEQHQREGVDCEVNLEIEKKALIKINTSALVTGETRVHKVIAGNELGTWTAKIYLQKFAQ